MQLSKVQKRSPEVFYKKGCFKIFAIFTGKHLCWSPCNKVAGLKTSIVIKKRLQVFFCEYCKIFKTPISKIIYERLFLKVKLNFTKVCKLSRLYLKLIGQIFSKYLFKWLFLKVQHFETQLKRGCFFINLQSYIWRVTFLSNDFWDQPYHFCSWRWGQSIFHNFCSLLSLTQPEKQVQCDWELNLKDLFGRRATDVPGTSNHLVRRTSCNCVAMTSKGRPYLEL